MSNQINSTLGDLVKAGGGTIHTGPFGSQLHAEDYVAQGIPCIMPANMKGNRVDISNIAYISDKDAQRLSKYLVKVGDIVYSRRGNVTLKALIRKNEAGYFCGTGCLLLRPGNLLDPDYLTYYLSTPKIQSWIISQSIGATMPNINTGILARIPFSGPEKAIQEKISSVLRAIDDKIALNNRINAELEAMAKTLYNYWFVQFDFPDTNGKPYKTSGGKMVYNATLKREIPAGWRSLRLNELLQNGADSTGSDAFNSDVPYTPIDALPMKKMSFGDAYSSDKANTSLIKYKRNDILIGAMRVYFHRVCIAPFDGITRTTTLVLRPNKKEFLPYIYQVCNEEKTINIAAKISVGTQQPYVNWENSLENLVIAYPEDDSLIQRYSSAMGDLVKRVISGEKESSRLKKLREWLLPLLMNGQVTVK